MINLPKLPFFLNVDLFELFLLNLSFDMGLKLCFFDGALNLSIQFLYVKTIEKVIRLHCVYLFFLVVALKIWEFLRIST